MNYLAHGIRFLDRPYFLAGTAVPDWLCVADRRVRMRARRVGPLLAAWPVGSPEHETLMGILQHLHDDDWFHNTPGFYEVTGRMTGWFRKELADDRFVCGFLGHIVTELLIDSELSVRYPGQLDGYYDALDQIDPQVVESVVNAAVPEPTDRLARFIPLFHIERFLPDYLSTPRLLHRLNQVMKRVQHPHLPDHVTRVLDAGRELVSDSLEALLPPDRFGWDN